MLAAAKRGGVLAAVAVALAGCARTAPDPGPDPVPVVPEPFTPEYLGVQTLRADSELVNFRVAMRGARDTEDVVAYARCAAAQYALIRGYVFARHVRTNVAEEGGIWRGDAVYTISPSLPQGLRTIDAEVTVGDCVEQGIPTV